MLDQVSLMDKLWLAQRPNNKTTLEITSNRLFFSIAPFQVSILWPVCISNTTPVLYSVNPRRQGSLNCHSPHKRKWQNKSQSQLPHLKVQGSNPPIQWGTSQNIGSKLRGTLSTPLTEGNEWLEQSLTHLQGSEEAQAQAQITSPVLHAYIFIFSFSLHPALQHAKLKVLKIRYFKFDIYLAISYYDFIIKRLTMFLWVLIFLS